MPTDLNTLDDWWNEGFDDFFAGAEWEESYEIGGEAGTSWFCGWSEAKMYRNAMKEQGQ
jgi:hypothetical protein